MEDEGLGEVGVLQDGIPFQAGSQGVEHICHFQGPLDPVRAAFT